jgi:hypothetical protein
MKYEGVSKSFRTGPITKYTLTTINTHSEATQRVMAAKLTRLTRKIAIQLHLVVESCTIYSSRSRRPVRKLLDTPSYRLMTRICTISTEFTLIWLKNLRPSANSFRVITPRTCSMHNGNEKFKQSFVRKVSKEGKTWVKQVFVYSTMLP